MKTNLLLVVVVMVALLVSACGGGVSPEMEAEPIGVDSVNQNQVVEVTVERQTTVMVEGTPMIETETVAVAAATPAVPLAEPPLGSTYENYGVSPYVETQTDRLSTFALDVDTASYTMARRYLLSGLRPPPEAVRVEEFVNYFEQDYALPSDLAFGIYADSAPLPFRNDGTHILRVGIKGYDVPPEQRPASALTFVIDTSGSMDQPNRLELAKQALQLLAEQMRPEDTIAIVTYGDYASVRLPPTSGANKDTIFNALNSLYSSGSTNAEAGIMLGYSLASESFIPGGINRVILCSDGVANVGTTDPQVLADTLHGYAEAGIALTTIGFGMGDYNDVLMEQLADQGNGNYGYVDTLDEAQRFLVDEMSSTLQTIALDAKVQVDFNPEVVARYRLMGYENRAVADTDFRNNAVDAGEIGAGHTVTALYELQFVPGATGQIGTVQLRWEDPATHEVKEIAGAVNTQDIAPSFEAAAPRYQQDVIVAYYAELLRGSPYTAGISFPELGVRTERLAAQLGDPDISELATLLAQASQSQ